ncbi:conserved exported hypothetical protein [uncultured delta proteobacterium]|uniref:Uncharacterized protein n=1 Tax=uncultured delta proteobacterium TaxID=34034 RepID=A0A212JCV8_9DELT|nr:conserved exported hypothetical protein [uncultured delta proteobacterium]
MEHMNGTGNAGIALSNSATVFAAAPAGRVAVTGSHGGVYPAYLLAKLRVRGSIFNDAGVGREHAGIGGLAYLQSLGIPAATVGNASARIGYGEDTLYKGIISHANAAARALGCVPGMPCLEAAQKLCAAPLAHSDPPAAIEARHVITGGSRRVVLIDSAALVLPEDAGNIVITGSHGGLLGGNKATALKYDAYAAFYNDAGGGLENAGTTRLPALDERNIAGITVSSSSARIGDAVSSYEDGVISAVNATAARYGAKAGMTVKRFVDMIG